MVLMVPGDRDRGMRNSLFTPPELCPIGNADQLVAL